eukprot:606921_1
MAFVDVVDTAGNNDNIEGSGWSCTSCTFRNHYADNDCQMCGNKRPSSDVKPTNSMTFPKWIALTHGTKSIKFKSASLRNDPSNAFNTLLLFSGIDPTDEQSTDIYTMQYIVGKKTPNNSRWSTQLIMNSTQLLKVLSDNGSAVLIQIKIVLQSVFDNRKSFVFKYNDVVLFQWMPRSLINEIKVNANTDPEQLCDIDWAKEYQLLQNQILMYTPIMLPVDIQIQSTSEGEVNDKDALEYSWDVCHNNEVFTVQNKHAEDDDDIKVDYSESKQIIMLNEIPIIPINFVLNIKLKIWYRCAVQRLEFGMKNKNPTTIQ